VENQLESAFSPEKSALNIYTPSTPAHLRITESMRADLVENPVLAAKVILGETLDEFQKNRLIKCWWTPRVMDSSGLGCGKTKNMWMVSNLRCILIPDHWCLVYFQTFTSGQRNYWKYYSEVGMRSRLFATQVGKLDVEGEKDGKATKKGPSCYTCYFKNGSQIEMPAGGFDRDATSQAGINTNDLCIDEYTKIDGTGSTGIDDQLIGRARRHSFNQNHPFWCNHHLMTATAEDVMHPSFERYSAYKRRVDAGDPDYQIINYSIKDYSNLPFDSRRSFKEVLRDDRMMKDLRTNKTVSGFLQEALGIWSQTGKGLYTQDLINQCYAIGRSRKANILTRFMEEGPITMKERQRIWYFLGADPAPSETKKADDGALVVSRASPITDIPTADIKDWRLEPCWAYKVRKSDPNAWAALIHRKMSDFGGFALIEMDSQGGGQWIAQTLKNDRQVIKNVDTKVVPIACIEDEATMSLSSSFILSMFRITDYRIQKRWGSLNMRHPSNLINMAHTELCTMMENGIVGLPPRTITRLAGEISGWSEEKKHASLMIDLAVDQLKKICVRTEPDGKTYFNQFGAREFSAKGKKDMAYAFLYSAIGFLAWLKNFEALKYALKPEDRAGGASSRSAGKSHGVNAGMIYTGQGAV
jgi:hypothetical protein